MIGGCVTGQLERYKRPQEEERIDILIVDDQLDVLRSLQALLQINGYYIEVAKSGDEALGKLNTQLFHVVLLDLKMPGIDGFDLISYIKDVSVATEIIIVSAYSSFGFTQKGMRLGANDFIRKPYDPEELLKSVKQGVKRCQKKRQDMVANRSLSDSERIHRFIINNSPDLIYMLNNQGIFTFLNDQVEVLLGYQRSELLGQHFSKIIHPNNAAEIHNYFSEQRTGSRATKKIEMRLQVNPENDQVACLANHELIVELNAVGIYKNSGHGNRIFSGTLGCARDISERKKNEAHISFQAYHDMLTRLPNRMLFDDRMMQAFAHARRSGIHFALLFIDLDRFKLINDTLGHVVGDVVLQQVAERISNCLRAEDTLSRFGGDEFFLLLPGMTSRSGVAAVAEKILEAVRKPFHVDDHDLYISMSIGIAMYPEAGESREALLQSADIAMYHVKRDGKDGFCFYDHAMPERSDYISVERDMKRGMEEHQFQVFFQPRVNVSDNRIVGMEALIRWQHPEHGLLYPEKFLHAAEESKLIVPLGKWVLESVCQEIVRWKEQGLPDIRVALNLSLIQLEQNDFIDHFVHTLQSYQLKPECLELEISEHGLQHGQSDVTEKLNTLKAFGVSLTLDDFGRGNSSFAYLHNLPISTLKIDRSFVREINNTTDQAFVADGIAMLAKGMNFKLAAEGVENQHQLQYLLNLGCKEVQGHLYAEALAADRITTLFNTSGSDLPHFSVH